MPHPDYVSGSEFKRWMDEESAFRGRIEKRMADNFAEIKQSVSRIESLQRETNGRLNNAERTIAVVERDIDAIKSEDSEIERLVTSIQRDGCHQYAAHEKVLEVLEGSGAMPNSDGTITRSFTFPALSRRQKVAAGVGVTALLIPAVAELFKLATALVTTLADHTR